MLLAIAIFSVVLLLLLTVSLVRWVRRPLRRTMESLNRDDPAPIVGLCKDNSEFGELARTIRKFFEQRDNLIREIEERRATEEALAQERRRTAAFAKDGSDRPAGRRSGARLQ